MGSDERLKDLGLLHLQHRPRALRACLDEMWQVYRAREREVARMKATSGKGKYKELEDVSVALDRIRQKYLPPGVALPKKNVQCNNNLRRKAS